MNFENGAHAQTANRTANINGLGYRETMGYDSLGRVVETVSAEGRVTTYQYAWDGTIAGLTGAAAGGWRKTVVDAVGMTMTDDNDVFGRLWRHRDLGGHVFDYSYNIAGWLTLQTGSTGQRIAYDYYKNGYLKRLSDETLNRVTQYEYDAVGNRTLEAYATVLDGGVVEQHQHARIVYDELNRVAEVVDPKAHIQYEYDAAGNRRRVLSLYHDGVGGDEKTQDYWYAYDNMNRFTVTMGSLVDAQGTVLNVASNPSVRGTGSIARGAAGTALGYDAASQRVRAVGPAGA